MFEKPSTNDEKGKEGVEDLEGLELSLDKEINQLENNSAQLELALESVGGEEGLQNMIGDLSEDSKRNILSRIEDEHENRMREILREQEKAGELMDEGWNFMWNPKFVYEKALKSDRSNDEGWATLKAAVSTPLLVGTGSAFLSGLGGGTIGAARHFVSRFKEMRESKRHEKEMRDAGLA